MKTLLPILFLLAGYCTFGQQTPDKSEVNHGVSLKALDSSESANTTIMHFESSHAVIFPSSYAKKLLGLSYQYKDATFITPDTNLVKMALQELKSQYCAALLKFNKRTWQKEKLHKYNKLCPVQQSQLPFKNKQIIAYSLPTADTILYIQLVDFRQDPYNLKPFFTTSWIDGWHGWFETNTMRFHYHSSRKLLTINADL